jgi:hypothetical protein
MSSQMSMQSYAPMAIFEMVAVLCVVTTHLAASGRLERNSFAGFRIPSAMASDAAWRAGHRAAVPIMWLTVPLPLVGLAGVASKGLVPPAFYGLLPIAFAAIVIAAAVVAGKAARRV